METFYTRKHVTKDQNQHFYCGGDEYVYENGAIYKIENGSKIFAGDLNGRSVKTAIADITNIAMYS